MFLSLLLGNAEFIHNKLSGQVHNSLQLSLARFTIIGDQRNSKMGKAFSFLMADLGSIPGTQYVPSRNQD